MFFGETEIEGRLPPWLEGALLLTVYIRCEVWISSALLVLSSAEIPTHLPSLRKTTSEGVKQLSRPSRDRGSDVNIS